MQSIRLSSGYDMPLVGLGTWKYPPEENERIILTALEAGYRHFDTAFFYNNEEDIGSILKKWFAKGGKREELFITSKLPPFGNRPRDVEKFIKLSLERLQLDYLDMYLIHMPFALIQDPNDYIPATEPDGSNKLDLETNPLAVWKEMEKQVINGNTRSIGLSNFNEKQITEVWESADIKPSNLQIELHAFHQQKQLCDLCKKYNIAVTAYSPLTSPSARSMFDHNNLPDLLGDPVIQKIATSHGKTTAQVMLHHLVKKGVAVVPRSSNSDRIKGNIKLFDFELTKEETELFDALDRGKKGRIFDFTFFKGVEKHPDFQFKDEVNQ